jgi:hypothetical protein
MSLLIRPKSDYLPYKEVIKPVMKIINYLLGLKTSLNYNTLPIINNSIVIPIIRYTADEVEKDTISLIQSKIEELIDYFKTFNYNFLSNERKWHFRALEIKTKTNISSIFSLNVVSDDEFINSASFWESRDIEFPPFPEDYKIKTKFETFDESCKIVQIIDPLISENGIFYDISIPFEELNFGHNLLHIYEHLQTKAWEGLEETDLIDYNGRTLPTGISLIYTTHKSMKSLKLYLNALLTFIYKQRNQDFWNSDKMKEYILLETKRTISETRKDRSLSCLGRSNVCAYSNNYKTEVFHYWANKPFNILLIASEEIEFNLKTFSNKNPLKKNINIENYKFNYMPLEVFRFRALRGTFTTKKYKSLGLMGKNNSLISLKENLTNYNCLLYKLLIQDQKQVLAALSTHILPYKLEAIHEVPE